MTKITSKDRAQCGFGRSLPKSHTMTVTAGRFCKNQTGFCGKVSRVASWLEEWDEEWALFNEGTECSYEAFHRVFSD